MPNVKIWGLESLVQELWYESILNICGDKSFAEEMVITTTTSRVRTLKGEDAPYLEITSLDGKEKTAEELTLEVFEALRVFNIDIEMPLLNRFEEGERKYNRLSTPPESTAI